LFEKAQEIQGEFESGFASLMEEEQKKIDLERERKI